MRTLHIICYDITDDQRRATVAHLLEGYGSRVQESLFEIYLDVPRTTRLRQRLLDMIDPLTDRIRLYSLCNKDAGDRQALGKVCQVVDFAYIVE
jgi:CRISPR-associated protein Cas2